MPMPIVKPIGVFDKEADVEYMSFTDALKLPFTNAHQPSLAVTALRAASKKKKIAASFQVPSSRISTATPIAKLKNRTNFKIGVAAKVRGVVECNTCHKPRCIYSLAAVSQMKPPPPHEAPPSTQELKHYQALAKGRLDDAVESHIFICGMAPLDSDEPFHDIFLCDPSLDCDTHIEPEFYVSRIVPTRLELCCHCTGVFELPIDLNIHLKAPEGPYSVVLPICKACIDGGCHIIVRAARANATAMQDRLDRENNRETVAASTATRAAAEAAATAAATSATTTTSTPPEAELHNMLYSASLCT